MGVRVKGGFQNSVGVQNGQNLTLGAFGAHGPSGSEGPLGGGGCHKASVLGCLPLAAPIGLSSLLILTLCGPKRALVVSTETLDNLSCLTTPGSVVPETDCCPCR